LLKEEPATTTTAYMCAFFYHIETTISIQLTYPINIVYNKIEITLVHLHLSLIKSSINIASKE